MAGLRDEELAYRKVQMLQGELYEGLFDDRGPRLLNPAFLGGGDDATMRRFAQLEIE
jgi:hypothetical protein